MKRFLLLTMMCVLGLFGTLRAQESSFSYNFDDGSLTGWTTFAGTGNVGNGWQISPEVPSYQTYYKGVDNTNAIVSLAYDVIGGSAYKPNAYIVTSEAYAITETSKLSWYAEVPGGNATESEHYYLVVSEDNTNWTSVFDEVCPASAEKEYSFAGTEYVGKTLYIGFQHIYTGSSANSNDAVILDNIVLTAGEGGGEGEEPETPEEPAMCNVIFTLNDAGKDGWYGGYLTVSYGTSSEDITCASGETVTHERAIPSGSEVTVKYTAATQYTTYELKENSFTIEYESGELVVSAPEAGSQMVDGTVYEFTVDCSPKLPEKPVVVAEAISGNAIVLTIDAMLAETFNIYKGAELYKEGVTEEKYLLEGLDPETTYCFTVEAVNEVGISERSAEVCATTYKEGTALVQIGEGTENYTGNSPIRDYYSYSLSQTIYTADEIGFGAGLINSIYYNQYTGNNNTRNISVYMKNTENTSLSSAWETLAEASCVYSGEFTFGESGWIEIKLQEQFGYTGGNLMVCVIDNTGVYATVTDYFYTYKTGTGVRSVFGNDTKQIDPLNITNIKNTLNNTSYANVAPQAKFIIEPASTPVAPEAPVVAAETLSATEIKLTWDAVEGATSYNVYLGTDTLAKDLTETTFTATGLTPFTEYSFTVKAANEAGESEASNVATAKTLDLTVTIPANVVAEALNATEIKLTWDVVENALSYNVYSADTLVVNVTEATYTVTELTPFTEYSFTVTAVRNEQETEESAVATSKTLDLTVTIPANVVAEALNATEIKLTWNVVENALSYNVYSADTLVVNVTEATYTVTELTPDTEYSFTVTAVRNEQETEESAVATAKTLAIPAAPANVVATIDGLNSAKITWDAVEGAERYIVYKGDVEWASETKTSCSIELETLPEIPSVGDEYCFAVKASVNGVESELSEKACAKVEALPENQILVTSEEISKYYAPFLTAMAGELCFEAIYKAEEIGQAGRISELAFSYKDGKETTADINIYLAETTKAVFENENDTIIENELTLVYSGTGVTLCDSAWETFVLNEPFKYSGEKNLLLVVTKNSGRSANNWHCYNDPDATLIKKVAVSPLKPVVKLTLSEEPAPEAPVVKAEATSDTTIVLTWDKVEGATSYNVYQGAEAVATSLKATVTDTTYTVKGLTAETEYTFVVTAVNEVGESAASNAATAKTLAAEPVVPEPTVPAAPVLAADSVKVTTVVLTWNVVEGATSYNVYQGADSIANVTDTTYTVTGLTAETEYTFVVKAVNEVGESEASNEVSVKTLSGEGIAENAAAFNVYPNPVNDKLFIETESYIEEVSIYSLTGTLVYKEVDFNSNTIDVSDFAGGVYIMKVRTDNGEAVQRFVKK